jgi:hypothetical protein
MAIERLYFQPKTPKLFDRAIQDIQKRLGGLSWLDHIFGRCERLVKKVEGVSVYSPNVYAGGNEYILLTPDNKDLGNYCFFVMDEPETIGVDMGSQVRMKAPFSLVVWVDMRRCSEGDDRNIYDIENAVLDVITGHGVLRNGHIEVSRVWHNAENVFRGFTLDEVDNQFLMAPFAGFRIQGELTLTNDCVL